MTAAGFEDLQRHFDMTAQIKPRRSAAHQAVESKTLSFFSSPRTRKGQIYSLKAAFGGLRISVQELSSVQYYTIDEQLTEFTAALKEQYSRHCFIKLPGEDAEPMLVPNVEQFYIAERHRLAYEDKLFLMNSALPASEVDRLLIEQETAFIQAARSRFGASPPADSNAGKPAASEASDLVGDSPIWKRVSSPEKVLTSERVNEDTIPPTVRRKKPGRKPDLSSHAKVAVVVAKYGDTWDSDEKLPEVCVELDSAGVPPSTEWATLKPPALSWDRARQLYRDRVIKAIVYRRDNAARDQT